MIIEDFLTFEKWEAQEAVGFLHSLKGASKEKNFNENFDLYEIESRQTIEAILRNKFYRLTDLKCENEAVSESHTNLFSYLIERIKPDPTIHQKKNINLYDAVSYKLHFPCQILQDDSPYSASLLCTPFLYIFNTQELLFNLILAGYNLPEIAQKYLGIRPKKVLENQKKHRIRNVMVQTIAHIAFSLNNKQLRWNQKTLAQHPLIKNFSLDLNLSKEGSRRTLRDAIKEIIPEEVRKKGNREITNYTDEEIKKEPLIIPEVIDWENGEIKIDFSIVKVILRTALLFQKGITPKGKNITTKDLFCLPVLRQIIEFLNEKEMLIFNYELQRYSKKFGRMDYFQV